MIEFVAKLEAADEELTRLRRLVKAAYFEGSLGTTRNRNTYISVETLWVNSSAYEQLTFHKREQQHGRNQEALPG